MVHRAKALCTNTDDYEPFLRKCFHRLLARGHQKKDILPVFNLAIARVINKTGVSPRTEKPIDTNLKFHREIHPDDPSSKAIRSVFRSTIVSPAQKPHIQQLDCPNGSQVLFQDLYVCHHGQTSLKSVLAPHKGRLPETFQVSTFLDSL